MSQRSPLDTRPYQSRLREADLDRFRDLIHAQSGLDFPPARRQDLEHALLRTLAETNLPDADSLYRLLVDRGQGNPHLEALIANLTIGETHFFRNQPQFQALEQQILPDLIERRRATRTLRLWSAGCASGEEPYSLAILLQRLLPDYAAWNILILATDINVRVLEKARRGYYGAWSFREVPPEIEKTYFISYGDLGPRGREFEIAPRVRAMVTFAYLNLAEDVYPSLLTNTNALDLILCRNVFIYFSEEMTRRVVGRLHEALAEHGWLIVGHAEPLQNIFFPRGSPTHVLRHQFVVRNLPGTSVYQKAPAEQQPQSRATWVTLWPALVEPPFPRGSPTSPLAGTFDFRGSHRSESPVPLPTGISDPRGSPIPIQKGLAVRRSPWDTPGLEQARTLWEAGSPDEALRLLKALAQSNPGDVKVYYLLAKIHANLLQFEPAAEWIDKAIQQAPAAREAAPAHYLRGLILQEQCQLEQAREALRRCIYADPQFVLGHFAQAGLYARQGETSRARKALDNVKRLLANRKRKELITEGDGLTVGRLLELIAVWGMRNGESGIGNGE